jgi:hypothetical protein
MAVLFTTPHGTGARAVLLERGLAGHGGPIRRDRQISPRLQLPNGRGCDAGHHQE